MKAREKIIFVDVDGTLIDFKSIDKQIINNIYSDSKLVKFIDRILWWFNDFDLIGYSNAIFYARIFLYSILSNKNFKKSLVEYKNWYSKYTKKQITPEFKNTILELENNNYQVCVVTRNMYAACLSELLEKTVHVVKDKKVFYSKLCYNYRVSHIIGNNYMDDIVSCYLLNLMYKKRGIRKTVTPVYIGKSKVVRKIAKKEVKCFEKFNTCVEYLKNVVD